jgi:hypothetical protein
VIGISSCKTCQLIRQMRKKIQNVISKRQNQLNEIINSFKIGK